MTTLSRRAIIRSTLATGFVGATSLAVAQPALAAPNDPISRADVIDRAWNWTNRNIQYGQTGTATGPDGVHSWRRDCSGFVSMALKLGPTGIGCPNTTALAGSTYGASIARANMKAGDYLVDAGDHCVTVPQVGERRPHPPRAPRGVEPHRRHEPPRGCPLSTYSGYVAKRAHNIRD